MTLKEIYAKACEIDQNKRGQIMKVHYVTIKGDYTKETETHVRFVKYSNIKGVDVKGKPNPNEIYVVNNILLFNKKNRQFYLRLETINTSAKANVKYYYQGQEIDKATYEMANPSKPRKEPLTTYIKNIKDIISIG